MKIGIFTQPLKENYGGILQNMAMQRVLRRMGHYPVTIDYDTWRPPLLGRIRLKVHRFFKKSKSIGCRNDIDRFILAQINVTTKVTTDRQLRHCMRYNQFDVVLTGSDQVWRRAYNPRLDWAFLSFANGLPRIAYAASIGVEYWDFTLEETSRCASLLKDFIAVSVREASAVELCRKYLGRNDVKVVLDPTMLLDASDYPSKNGAATDRPYVFTYILDWDDCKGRIVESLNKKLGLPEYSSEYNSFGKKREKRLSIEGWLAGISNANLVICDSFHGTAFSILNHRPFVVLYNPERGNTRMQWLLELFGLKGRMIAGESEIKLLEPIDWNSVDAILKREREKSVSFLRQALDACTHT